MIERSYKHMLKNYGGNGYDKNYCYDKEYEHFKQDVETILKDKWEFAKKIYGGKQNYGFKRKSKNICNKCSHGSN